MGRTDILFSRTDDGTLPDLCYSLHMTTTDRCNYDIDEEHGIIAHEKYGVWHTFRNNVLYCPEFDETHPVPAGGWITPMNEDGFYRVFCQPCDGTVWAEVEDVL